jgi:hypothetical protein
VSPIEPNDAGDGLNGGEDVARGFFVAGSDRSKLLDLDGEVVDQMSRAIKLPVIVAARIRLARGGITAVLPAPFSGPRTRTSASNARRHRGAGLIGDQRMGLHRWHQVVCSHQVVRFTAGQEAAARVAQRVDHGVDLGAQPTARAPDRLVLAGISLAAGAVLAVRPMVLLIIAYSLSGSTARY